MSHRHRRPGKLQDPWFWLGFWGSLFVCFAPGGLIDLGRQAGSTAPSAFTADR
jgi:hypothetical protein